MLISFQKSFAAAELLVKAGTTSFSGYSAISSDFATIYGGIAGNSCLTTDGISTCNSCIDTSGTLNACNQNSVYPNLVFSVSFKVTKTVTGIAKLFIESSTAGVFESVVTLTSATYTADTSTVTLQTTWSEICSRSGLSGSCVGSSALLASKGIRYGVDSDASGEIEEAERKTATVKLHYIPAGQAEVAQAYCTSSAAPTGAGVCNVAFLPGDSKAYIDSAVYNGDDASTTTTGGSITWESIAIFPIQTTVGGEAGVYTAFSNGAVQPVFNSINPADGSIPDSQVSGGMKNYLKYCMVYATKNKAQNIYKFVTTGVNTTKSCITPSEVAGLLDDKHCFISTAAFGSDSAPEVEIFRNFRNHFLLNNAPGKMFVRLYYRASPGIAEIISENNFLKASTRLMLYPLVIFAFMALKIGITAALIVFLLAALSLKKLAAFFSLQKTLVIIFILLLVPELRAEIQAEEVKISHPLAQEGLVRIKKDGTYIYDIERPLKKESSRISFGQANHPEISLLIEQADAQGNPTGVEREFTFGDLYSEDSGLILGYDYERFSYTDKGKLGFQAGFSAMFANGHGRLKALPNDPSTESFTFVTLPITFGGVYRLEWKDKQLLAPYVSGGGTYVVLLEKREDKPTPSAIGSFGFYATGGLLFNIGALDRDAGFQLESEYGISNMWISLEFKVIEVSSSAFGFSNKYLNAGLSFDF